MPFWAQWLTPCAPLVPTVVRSCGFSSSWTFWPSAFLGSCSLWALRPIAPLSLLTRLDFSQQPHQALVPHGPVGLASWSFRPIGLSGSMPPWPVAMLASFPSPQHPIILAGSSFHVFRSERRFHDMMQALSWTQQPDFTRFPDLPLPATGISALLASRACSFGLLPFCHLALLSPITVWLFARAVLWVFGLFASWPPSHTLTRPWPQVSFCRRPLWGLSLVPSWSLAHRTARVSWLLCPTYHLGCVPFASEVSRPSGLAPQVFMGSCPLSAVRSSCLLVFLPVGLPSS